ncbi:tRNA (N6-threonylcarbamoyladenosine(37)-N6)-methyltransferase TrmO [candidate division WWE3 bacterium]|uniref:tRNA (N6-threonylcarbamoyladenosine(37)-N6)-methyltransferase TrmO n=1 Tax=candidate division WWE3 bacterium TaxID=2053526 RepID=A0A7X9DLD7_UNCKA|nr:tRNA (N6-threonylcarbamoyladenosine(37)-N6)-methyltransferase TrmO [candidate division WWE3 bacterium]
MGENYKVYSIGHVKRGKEIEVQLKEEYKNALLEVENFGHIIVVWWGDKYEDYRNQIEMQMKPPYAPNVLTGLFATRSPIRPNPINISVCKIKKVDHEKGIVTINQIDAFDGTPILDLKVYFPTCDRVKEPLVPQRFIEWGNWIPPEGEPPVYYDEQKKD